MYMYIELTSLPTHVPAAHSQTHTSRLTVLKSFSLRSGVAGSRLVVCSLLAVRSNQVDADDLYACVLLELEHLYVTEHASVWAHIIPSDAAWCANMQQTCAVVTIAYCGTEHAMHAVSCEKTM
jgi:hypothetical protein